MNETHARATRRGAAVRAGGALALCLLAAAGCSGSSGPTSQITVTRAGLGGGTVTSVPSGIDCGATCTGRFVDGTTVALEAAPNASSVVGQWSGCDHSSGDTCLVALEADRRVTLTFDPRPPPVDLTVTLAGSGGGTVSDGEGFACAAATCTHGYAAGSTVTLTATPDGSSAFGGFTGCDQSTGDTCTVTLAAATTVTATFTGPARDITHLQVTPGLESLHVTWTNPAIPSFLYAMAYVTWPDGSGTAVQTTGESADFTHLAPGLTYVVQVAAVATGAPETTGMTVSATTHCTGAAGDFGAGQSAPTLGGGIVDLAWSDATTGNLYVGLEGTLPAGDALWLALDTDPGAGDVTGATTFTDPATWACSGTCSQGAADVIWPFKADLVVALEASGNGRLWSAADPTTTDGSGDTVAKWTPLAVVDGATGTPISEWGVNLSGHGLDGTTAARFAFVVVDPATGETTDLAPASATATDVTGYFSSLTSSFAATPFDLTGLSGTVGTTSPAPSLVTVSVTDPGATGPVQLLGSRHPFSTTLADSHYQLAAGSTAGAYTGTFNLGGASGDLYFQLTAAGMPETLGGASVDRVYALSGATESLPGLTFGQSYDGHALFILHFVFTDDGAQGVPLYLAGSTPELGSGTPGSGATADPVPGTPDQYQATVTFNTAANPSATPLTWQIAYAGGALETGGVHRAQVDVVGHATFRWTARDGATFP